jgi:hypothetical protein
MKTKTNKELIIKLDIFEDMKYSLNRIWAGWNGSQWVRKAKRDLWHSIIEQVVEEEEIKPIDFPVEIYFEFWFRTRTLDCSNCSVMVKLIEDGLVCAWVLKDDTPQYIRHIHIKSHFLSTKEKKWIDDDFVHITIKKYEEE